MTDKQGRVILKLKDKKLQCLIKINGKVFQQKSLELSKLIFSGKFFISKSMCYENQQLVYKYCEQKNFRKIHSTWFWNNAVNIKVTPNGDIHQIFHTTDTENLLGIKHADDFINNISF